jgi:pyruvate dehydrogenase E2 component (dihydrolipoamide acetyltransferase)
MDRLNDPAGMFRPTVDRTTSTPERDAAGVGLKGETTVEEPDRIERAIARRSAETRATVPDLEMSIDVDASRLLAAATREGVSTTALLVGACAAALREWPRANGAYRDGRFELYSRVNLGITVLGPRSQLIATILDADLKSSVGLDQELARLRSRALAGELTPPEQAGSTFTFADLGPFGVDRADPLIVGSQAASLTAGMVRSVPVVRDGVVAPGHVVTLTLAADHRILFGAQAAGFLAAIAARLTAL